MEGGADARADPSGHRRALRKLSVRGSASPSDAFLELYGAPPTHLVRAPGRVNLIGEHTDYNDLPVLPMALRQQVRIVLRRRADTTIRLHNMSPEFDPVTFDLAERQDPGPGGHWGNYVRAPAVELARRFAVSTGFDGVADSDVPVASGLSSSSALVNAVGLALARLSSLELGALELAEVMAEAERFTGTRGGGMDQAISLGAVEGTAALIEFGPLRITHAPLPEDWRFVVADTGVRAEKSGAAQSAYNERRAACEEALEAVGRVLASQGHGEDQVVSYPALLERYGLEEALKAGASALRGTLAARFRHVVTEARRVRDAFAALGTDDPRTFGSLMDASHESLRVDYEVSSPELDVLVETARASGALGARLTGAGFGGCIVALTTPERTGHVVEALREGRHRGPDKPRGAGVFVAEASGGASFRELGSSSAGVGVPSPA